MTKYVVRISTWRAARDRVTDVPVHHMRHPRSTHPIGEQPRSLQRHSADSLSTARTPPQTDDRRHDIAPAVRDKRRALRGARFGHPPFNLDSRSHPGVVLF